ncbi:MAG TPA: VOC family protein [Candidatus Binatia bacterium]|nr:VOC family protein [Candidatus Binatia bacterium]
MPKANDLHHLAISTADIKKQIEFFSDVLGMELVALYWMHGVEGCFHAFLKLHDTASVAFVQTPHNHEIAPQIGVSHAGNPTASCAPGTMQHVAFNVDSDADLLAMRDRIRSRGIQVLGPLDHGLCKSIYFAGPENLSLEIASSSAPIDARAWIDPEVVALNGISASELARYMKPAPYAGEGGTVAQPPFDPAKPNQTWPANFQEVLSWPDEKVTATMSQNEPPVKVAVERPGTAEAAEAI